MGIKKQETVTINDQDGNEAYEFKKDKDTGLIQIVQKQIRFSPPAVAVGDIRDAADALMGN